MHDDFEDIDLDNVESTFRSNILAMFAITKYGLPYMKEGGSIINTTSVVAFRGTGSMVDYASSKGAIVGFTRALAKHLVSRKIRVNAVAPGPVFLSFPFSYSSLPALFSTNPLQVHTPLQPASRPAEQMEGFGKKSQLDRPGTTVAISSG